MDEISIPAAETRIEKHIAKRNAMEEAVERAKCLLTFDIAVDALLATLDYEATFEGDQAAVSGKRSAEDCAKSAKWYLEYSRNAHDIVNAMKQIMIAKHLEDRE